MDLSPLIFVALAVAWVAYLVPKAIRHHDEVNRSRSVERFSATMRVLARREPVGTRDSRLVVSPGRPRSTSVVTTKETVSAVRVTAPADLAPRSAASRRRRVLGVVLALLVITVALAATGLVGWAWTAVPTALLVAWLAACRLMVRAETGRSRGTAAQVAREEPEEPEEDAPGEITQEVAVVVVEEAPAEQTAARAPLEPGMWDPVPVTLPTYVDKAPAARRTVRTIDLDSTGVWTSGRSEVDSALAREAEEAERAERAAEQRRASEQRRATGS